MGPRSVGTVLKDAARGPVGATGVLSVEDRGGGDATGGEGLGDEEDGSIPQSGIVCVLWGGWTLALSLNFMTLPQGLAESIRFQVRREVEGESL